MNNKVVYAFLREDNTPFYIGMGSIDRARNHKKGSRNYRWWEEMKANPNYKFVIVDRSLTKQQAWDLEIELIKEFGRKDVDEYGILTNIHPGGSYFGDSSKKVVIQFNLDGYRLNEFDSSVDAERYIGVKPTQSGIRMCTGGRSKSYGGFQWYKKSEVGDIDYIGPVERKRNRNPKENGKGNNTRMKPVIDVKTLKVYKSKRAAGRAYFPNSTIGFTTQKWFVNTFMEITKEEYKILKQLENE